MLELQGREFDWFALDGRGNLALFATAGEGFILDPVVDRLAKHEAVSELLPSPHVGSASVWNDYAALGLFVYDWSLPGGPYERRAVPTSPMATQLRAKILEIGNLPTILGSFKELHKITHWAAT